ncbi:uncharacterized protein LOC120166960 isoform X2 [Hibiscus syriacus]|uniref:uncharacterized protein LOC120166960 isoform X2 n=1 Tax=Hibiscus syriacus TaxID=106335 RepID=UPI001920BEDC|nr:uncharacterized protein LOC120166960 isoform X2 [Hibiscus syriacus]
MGNITKAAPKYQRDPRYFPHRSGIQKRMTTTCGGHSTPNQLRPPQLLSDNLVIPTRTDIEERATLFSVVEYGTGWQQQLLAGRVGVQAAGYGHRPGLD